MASHYYPPPFVYSTPYLYPYYQSPQASPFIPPLPFPSSPEPPRRRVHFDDDEYPPRMRERRPSWHAGMPGMAPPPNPAPFPSPPFMVAALPPMVPIAPAAHVGHHRRQSDGNLPQPAWYPWPTYPAYVSPYVYQQPLPAPQLHPMLNGEAPDGPALMFDLSLHSFNPKRLSSPGASSGTPLSMDELAQTATYPGIRRMTITCDMIPQWPITLEPKEHERSGYLSVPSASSNTPITVGDVLIAIHRSLQLQISHVDWARLSQTDETTVARAYTRRCRTFPSAEAFEKSRGVRRVDYLADNFMFRGLARSSAGQDGFEKVKLLVGPQRSSSGNHR